MPQEYGKRLHVVTDEHVKTEIKRIGLLIRKHVKDKKVLAAIVKDLE